VSDDIISGDAVSGDVVSGNVTSGWRAWRYFTVPFRIFFRCAGGDVACISAFASMARRLHTGIEPDFVFCGQGDIRGNDI